MSGPLEFPLQKIKSVTNNFSEENFIGEGFLGKIYEGQLSLSGELVDVAVRRLDYSLRLQEILFEKEISVLTRFNHKNMVSVVGFCYENDEMLIVSERVARGSLSMHLSDPRLTWMRRLQISVGAASALSYLHNEVGHDYSVVHQNINSDSILLDENWEAKVSGFEYCMTIPAGNLDLAYEKLRIGIYKSDVFSIGVVLFELLCGKEAFASNSSFQASLAVFHYENGKLHEFVDPGLYSQMDPKSFNIFAKIAYNCLIKQRVPPTMNEVLERLERALKVQQMHENKGHSAVAVEHTIPEHLKLKLKSLEHMRIPLADIELATKNFSKDLIVSSGAFGSVYKADLEVPNKQRSTVAIKHIVDTEDEMSEQGFYTEIEMLTSCKHSNIITLLGFCDDGGAMILIYDYASKGSLNYHLQNMSNNHNDSWVQRVKMCLDAAKGLSYLHTTNNYKEKEIVHRDIKSSNILLDANFEAKIGDFGFSVFITEGVEHYTWSSRTVAGTQGYIDPQYSKDGKLKKESDVYSFGVVMFEILCGTVAYDRKYVEKNNKGLALLARQHFNEGAITEMVDPKIKEEIKGSSQESLDMFSEIAYRCLAEKQAERPTMEEIVMVLEIVIFLQGRSFTRLFIPSEDIRKATNNFTQGQIGEGSFGKVYRAELELPVEENAAGDILKERRTVVIKCITASLGKLGFNAEIEMLSSCKHRNIISLLSFSYYESNLILVYEYASNGRMDDYLESSTKLTWVQRIKIGIDIARALDYLHTRVDEQVIIHRDVKSGNILLGQNLEAKIADFGFSRFHHANQHARSVHTQHVAGTYMYLCPEYAKTGRLTTMVDIYSFGVVLFELLSGRLAYDSVYLEEDESGIAQVARQHFKDKRINEMVDLKIMEEVDDELMFLLHKGPNQDSLRTYSDIAYRCVAKAQDERPTAKEILHELHKALLYQENHKDSLQMSLEEIMVATKDFSRENLIGSGGFGNVYEGEVTRGSESTKIIAKRFHGKKGQGEEHFFMELEILYDYKHENIIGLQGYCNENHEKIIVYEHASNKSLDRHLGNASLTWTKRLQICTDIACGLAFLHGGAGTKETVIHGDIKSANILLTGDWKAKIFEFGLSARTAINQKVSSLVVGTAGYVDPQAEEEGFFTEKSDIYSLGVVLFEALSGQLVVPTENYDKESVSRILNKIHEEGKLESVVFKDIKEQIAPKSLSAFQVIVSQCLVHDREKRPTAKMVLQQLEKSLELQEDYEIWGPKLPKDYEKILNLSTYSETYSTKMKKELHDLFMKGILLQDDKLASQFFALGSNGERIEMISARTFSYRSGSPHDNWCINVPMSRFKTVAEMLDISNLMIKIETRAQFLAPNTVYGVYLFFKFCDSISVSGTPMHVDLKYRKGNETLHAYFAKWRDDEWMMIELYRFLNHKDDGDFEVLLESLSTYCCKEHDAIYVEGIVFQPINDVEHEETENSREIQQVLESNLNSDQVLQMPTKSEIMLKGSINYDYGKELFSLTEVNGKKHLMLSAKATLYNISDSELFVPIPSPKSRFKEVLELLTQQVFRISCTIKSQMLSRDADYVCYLVFKLSENCNEMHGPVEVRDLLQKNKVPEFVYFRTPSPWNIHNITHIPKQRSDGWMEVNVKKFNSNFELENDCVRVNLKFVSYEGSLSGLIVSGLEFKPM